MLENYLLDRRWLLAALAILVTAVSVGVGMVGQALFRRQGHLRMEESTPLGFGDRVTRRPVGQAILPLAFVTIFVAFALSLDRVGFGAIAGGLLVGQSVGAFASTSSLLSMRRLGRRGEATGELTYSLAYRYSTSANQLLAFTLVVWLAYFLKGGPMLLGGGAFLSALTLGHLRRARQARKRSEQAVKPDAA
jgi:hypothetical protein